MFFSEARFCNTSAAILQIRIFKDRIFDNCFAKTIIYVTFGERRKSCSRREFGLSSRWAFQAINFCHWSLAKWRIPWFWRAWFTQKRWKSSAFTVIFETQKRFCHKSTVLISSGPAAEAGAAGELRRGSCAELNQGGCTRELYCPGELHQGALLP